MCNLSDLIEERATEQGIEQGLEQGIKIFVETLKETGQSNEFIINALVNKFSLSEADAKKYVCNCQKSI